MKAMKISASGLDVEWKRLQIIAQNLANVNSTRMADGGVYKAQRLLSGPDISFEKLAGLNASDDMQPVGVTVLSVTDSGAGVRRSHEPSHPHADEQGFVFRPEINHSEEMSLMIRASRAYEANLSAISIAQQMYNSALEMGR